MVAEIFSLLTEASKPANSEDSQAKYWSEQARLLMQLVPTSIELQDKRVIELLLGWDKGLFYFSLVVLLLIYNAGRAWVTYWVVLLREEEERSSHCPAWKDYRQFYFVHRCVAILLFVACLSSVVHAWHWLSMPVLLPA